MIVRFLNNLWEIWKRICTKLDEFSKSYESYFTFLGKKPQAVEDIPNLYSNFWCIIHIHSCLKIFLVIIDCWFILDGSFSNTLKLSEIFKALLAHQDLATKPHDFNWFCCHVTILNKLYSFTISEFAKYPYLLID